MLDLFSGTGSVAEAFRRKGFRTFTVDSDARVHPDYKVDVLTWDYRSEFQPGDFDVVFAAPPCTEYSQALTSRPRKMEAADKVVRKALEIIRYLRPMRWFLENPATGYLKTRGILDGVPSIRVDYCRFAPWGYQKPTQVWGTVEGLRDALCDPSQCPNMTFQEEPDGTLTKRHIIKLEGSIVTLREKYRIPRHLVAYLMQWRPPPSISALQKEVVNYLRTEPYERQQQNHLRRKPSTKDFFIYKMITPPPRPHDPDPHNNDSTSTHDHVRSGIDLTMTPTSTCPTEVNHPRVSKVSATPTRTLPQKHANSKTPTPTPTRPKIDLGAENRQQAKTDTNTKEHTKAPMYPWESTDWKPSYTSGWPQKPEDLRSTSPQVPLHSPTPTITPVHSDAEEKPQAHPTTPQAPATPMPTSNFDTFPKAARPRKRNTKKKTKDTATNVLGPGPITLVGNQPTSTTTANVPGQGPATFVENQPTNTTTTPSSNHVLEPRHLLPISKLVQLCGRQGHDNSGAMQLMLALNVLTQDGQKHCLHALIDTGAQTNCIRHDALPAHCYKPSQAPIRLSTVSGSPLPGGQREVQVDLDFRPMGRDGRPLRVKSWRVPASLYDASMKVDIILGYPWLLENRIGVLPHEAALQADWNGQQVLLRGWRSSGRGPRLTNTINTIGVRPQAPGCPSNPKKGREECQPGGYHSWSGDEVPTAQVGETSVAPPRENSSIAKSSKSPRPHSKGPRRYRSKSPRRPENKNFEASQFFSRVKSTRRQSHSKQTPINAPESHPLEWEAARMQLVLPGSAHTPDENLDPNAMLEVCKALARAAQEMGKACEELANLVKGGKDDPGRQRLKSRQRGSRRSRKLWYDESYAVRKDVIRDIVQELKCPTPTIDAFANARNHRFSRWWGEGGEHPDAFAVSWSREEFLWCNPPFSKFQQVVEKLKKDQAQCILIMPDWPSRPFWHEVQGLRKASVYFSPGSEIFELEGQLAPGIQWGLWAYWLDGSLPKQQPRQIAGIGAGIIVEEEIQGERCQRLRERIHRDFDGIVLCEEIRPNPPVRGDPTIGYARVDLRPGAVARKQRPIHLAGDRLEAMKEISDFWIEKKLAEDGPSPWSSPAFPVAKKGGKWRGVIDFRWLNENTLADGYPLPRIEDIIVRQGRNMVFSILDLKDAFHQVPMDPECRKLTGTSTPRGNLQWRVLAQGLKNGPPIFQRVVEYVLRDVRDVADPYFDDILIGTSGATLDEAIDNHDVALRRVLMALDKGSMVADQKKCKLFLTAVEFCGHILRNGTRTPSPGKLLAVQKWEPPTTVSGLRAFLGLENY